MENPRNALRSVASTSLLRHVAPPEGVHECFHEVGRSSPFWARKFARRQEPTPRLLSATIIPAVATRLKPVRRAIGYTRHD